MEYSKRKTAEFSAVLLYRLTGTNITGGAIRSRPHMDAGYDSHCHEHGDNGRTAVTDKGKRKTDNRHDTKAHTDIDDDLEQQHTCNSCANDSVHIVVGFYTDIDTADDNGGE